MFFKKLKYISAITAIMMIAFTACNSKTEKPASAVIDQTVHWSYTGENGPEHWYKLDPEFSIAKDGKEQSPIDIITSDVIPSIDLSKPELNYTDTLYKVNNNGHTIELVPDSPENYITLDGVSFTLQQMHLHAPAEHQLDGILPEMEIHLVHKDDNDNIAVIGLLVKEGQENRVLAEAFSKLPAEITPEGSYISLNNPINLSDLMPIKGDMYRYDGSLTTPPCSEGVKWSISQIMTELSKEQIDSFKDIYNGNNRPLQVLNHRVVYSCN